MKTLLQLNDKGEKQGPNPLERYEVTVSDEPLAVFDIIFAIVNHAMHHDLLRNIVLQSAAALIGLNTQKDEMLKVFEDQVERNYQQSQKK